LFTENSAGLTIASNVAIATGRAFGVPAVLCVKFPLYSMEGWILHFRSPR